VGEHLGRIRSPRESFAALIEAGQWVTTAERERLREEPFYVVGARPRHEAGGSIDAQTVFVIVAPGLWGEERRLLGLTAYPPRVAFARELAAELRDADAIGPFRLIRAPTSAGREAWRFAYIQDAPERL
jgi:hypothetical protein